MPYPFVAVGGDLSHWPHLTLFVTTRPAFCSTEPRLNRNGPGSESRPPRRSFMVSRRTAICLAVIGLSTAASIGSVSAADYPTRPVKWVVGYPPGGATDIIARLIGQRLSEKLGQQFVRANKPRARHNIAPQYGLNRQPERH